MSTGHLCPPAPSPYSGTRIWGLRIIQLSYYTTNIEFEQGVFLVDKTTEESQLAMKNFGDMRLKGSCFMLFYFFICSVDPSDVFVVLRTKTQCSYISALGVG